MFADGGQGGMRVGIERGVKTGQWRAITGGYLLTACFATGRAAALGALTWVTSVVTDLQAAYCDQ